MAPRTLLCRPSGVGGMRSKPLKTKWSCFLLKCISWVPLSLTVGLLLCLSLHPLPASGRQVSTSWQTGEEQTIVSAGETQLRRLSATQRQDQQDSPLYRRDETHSFVEVSATDPGAVLSDLYSNITGGNSSDPFFSTWVSAFNDTHNTSAVCSTDGQSLVQGVKCEGATVVAIDISSLNADLVAIPTSLGLLTSLTSLKLSSNLVEGGNGTLPSSLGSLTGLKEFDLSNMGLVGELPSSFSSLTGLTSLKLNNNNLTGTIPAYFSGFEALVSLEMQVNKFLGKLPGLFTGLNSLTKLFVYNNTLTGGLPPELGQATWLVQFKAHWNPFGGPLPESYGNFVNATHMDLRSVQVTGAIPPSWGNLKSMEYLHLEDNLLSGSIPSSFGQLTSLHEIYLNNNSLTGSMPGCWASLQELNTIRVDDGLTCPSGQGQTCCGGAPQLEQRFCSAAYCGSSYCSTCKSGNRGSQGLSTSAMLGVVAGVVLLLLW